MAPIASTGNVFHPISAMNFLNFSLLNSQTSVNVHPNVFTSKVAQACTVINNSARLAQQPNPQMPFCLILLGNLTSILLLVHPTLIRTFSKVAWRGKLLLSRFQKLKLMSLVENHSNGLRKKYLESNCGKPSFSLDHRMRYLKRFTSGKSSVFLRKSVKQRSAFVRENQLCFTCFPSGHMTRDCSSKLKCRKSG